MIASIAFRNFRALRNTRVALAPFNLVIGPNGSGKTSLIEAVQRLRTLAQLPLVDEARPSRAGLPEIEFHFAPPHEGVTARLSCVSDTVCDALHVTPPGAAWPELRAALGSMRSYVLDHAAMQEQAAAEPAAELRSDGANLGGFLAHLQARAPEAFSQLTAELLRILPEFRALEISRRTSGAVEVALSLAEDGIVPMGELSQGMLYLIAVLALAHTPNPPRVLCIEEIDRGIHPRMLREVRDALYRLSYPQSFGLSHPSVQIITTTHSPYFIDLFRDHPEEIVISQKRGRAARFERLSERADLPELLREGALGDLWFSGVLGGVPDQE